MFHFAQIRTVFTKEVGKYKKLRTRLPLLLAISEYLTINLVLMDILTDC